MLCLSITTPILLILILIPILAFTRAAGIFIFYLTTCANDYAKDAKRSTIFKQDILNALRELDFDEFVPPLEAFLEQYQKEQGEKKKPAKKSKDANSDGNVPMDTIDGENDDEDGENDDEDENDNDNDGNEEES